MGCKESSQTNKSIKCHTWLKIPYEKVTKTQDLHRTQESQEIGPFPTGDHKAARNRHDSIIKRQTWNIKGPRKKAPPWNGQQKIHWRAPKQAQSHQPHPYSSDVAQDTHTRIQKVFSEGVQLWLCFSFVDDGREDPNTTISGPAKRHLKHWMLVW